MPFPIQNAKELLVWCMRTGLKVSEVYLQVDETRIKVLDSDKKGATPQGYYWVYHSPLDKTVLFDYNPSRGGRP